MSAYQDTKTSSQLQILIADDHGIVRYGMMLIIKDLFPWAVVQQSEDVNQMLNFIEQKRIDLLIMDINMPGGNNWQILELIKEKQSDIKILVFSAYDEQIYAEKYMHSGANGYLHKDTPEQEVKKAITKVLNGGKYLSTAMKEFIEMNHLSGATKNQENPLQALSKREMEIARLLIKGLGVIDIAKTLNIQVSTVSTYKNRLFEKLKIGNLVELIEKFRLHGNLSS